MTNAEKFIEVMNATFGAGFTLDNLVQECSPCGALKICDMGCDTFTCDGCRKWWNKEFAAIPEQNPPLTLEQLRWMDGAPVWCDFLDGWGRYMIIQWHNSEFFNSFECGFLLADEYGKSWLAYRRRLEEAHKS